MKATIGVAVAALVVAAGGLAWAKHSQAITGQAFLMTEGGQARTCAGQKVLAYPDTKAYRAKVYRLENYFLDNVNKYFVMGFKIPATLRMPPASATARCSPSGKFALTGLARGDWLVVTQIIWSLGQTVPDRQGGFLWGHAHLGLIGSSRVELELPQ